MIELTTKDGLKVAIPTIGFLFIVRQSTSGGCTVHLKDTEPFARIGQQQGHYFDVRESYTDVLAALELKPRRVGE